VNSSDGRNQDEGGGDGGDGGGDGGPSMTTLLVVAGVLVGIAWFISTSIRHFGGIQDCVMQGRTDCATLPNK